MFTKTYWRNSCGIRLTPMAPLTLYYADIQEKAIKSKEITRRKHVESTCLPLCTSHQAPLCFSCYFIPSYNHQVHTVRLQQVLKYCKNVILNDVMLELEQSW